MATFPKKIWQYCLLTVMSLFFMSTKCDWDEWENPPLKIDSVPVTELQVSVLDNSGAQPVELNNGKCLGKALVVKVDPIWDSDADCDSLPEPIVDLEISYIPESSTQEINVTEFFKSCINVSPAYRIEFYEYYDSQHEEYLKRVRYLYRHDAFYMAYFPESTGQIIGRGQFKATLTFADGAILSGLSDVVEVY